MIFVKICGIRRAEDATAALDAGANALGFNFWPGSPRYIAPHEAAPIIATVPPEIWTVGVFVNETSVRVREIAAETGISVLQFHGNETPEYWDLFESFRRIKAFKVGPEFSTDQLAPFRSAAAYLLDGAVAGMHGGTGKTFDWASVEKTKAFGKILLAGGLRPQNVAEAVRQVQPWGVDVCTGVETEPGKKSPRLIQEFIKAVRAQERAIGAAAVSERI